MSARIGVDVGGTFTDVIHLDADGRTAVRKVLSTPPAYDRAVVTAVGELARANGGLAEIVHGTTVATNAVLERRGSRTALVTTEGFRDVLELRRLRVPHMYDLFWHKPPPLVERRLRLELPERMAADGSVVTPLHEDDVVAVARQLRELGVESVAVCLLHAYANPAHERLAGDVLARELPTATISLSSEILREQREYERSATTVVNAYVRPLMASYLRSIRSGLDASGIDAPLQIMQSSGGVMTSTDAESRPVFALESGPAAGVVAALGIARRVGIENAISFDMGGTTAKASLVERGELTRGREYEVGGSLSAGSRLLRGSGELLRIPTIDIAEIGAGGGSIAWLDPAGGLNVGPRSAGADPGPACYGRGGVEPTVTDANVVLGYMPGAALADGEIAVSVERAEEALARVAGPLGLSVEEAARGIHEIANARMTRALRSVSSEKGRDPRGFALVAYGGAGPLHANAVAEIMGSFPVLVPPAPGLLCAIGDLVADFRDEFAQTYIRVLPEADQEEVAAILEGLGERAKAFLDGEGIELDRQQIAYSADMRYHRQGYEIPVTIDPADARANGLAGLEERFNALHEQLYGFRMHDTQAEIVNLRAVGAGAVPKPELPTGSVGDADASGAVTEEHAITFKGESVPTRIYDRAKLAPGMRFDGPAIVTEFDSTTVVLPGYAAEVDGNFNILINPGS